MAKICFYTNELSPVTRGGIGSLIWDALHVLLAEGHAVTVLAEIDQEPLDLFRRQHAPTLPQPEALTIHGLAEVAPAPASLEQDFYTHDLLRSYLIKEALVELERRGERFDLIEFMDVWGPAYFTIVEKALGRHFQGVTLAVRNHGTLEHWHAFEAFPHMSFQMYVASRLEQYCMRHADRVLVASARWAEVCRARFGMPAARVVVSPPSLVAHDLPQPIPAADGRRDVILCHGKLEQRKGVEILVDAAVRLLSEAGTPTDLRVVFTGGDNGMAPEPGTYLAYLEKRIPAELRDRFEFTGHVPRSTIGELLGRTLFAVIPSRVESYCYAAHEVYAAGLPLILADIPAFEGTFEDGRNCLLFDGTATDLYAKMRRLLDEPALRAALSSPYPLVERDLGDGYRVVGEEAPAAAAGVEVTAFVLSAEGDKAAEEGTLTSLQGAAGRTWLLRPWQPAAGGAPLWLRGRSWQALGADGRPAAPWEVTLGPAAVMLEAGDEVDARYLPLAGAVLAARPEAAMVACWHEGEADWGESPLGRLVSRFSWELLPELAPLVRGALASRAVFRTPAGRTVEQWVEDRLGPFTDIGLAWQALDGGQTILTIPEPWVHCRPADRSALRLNLEQVGRLSLLFDGERHGWLQRQLPRVAYFLLQQFATDQGPLTLEELRVTPYHWRLPEPPAAGQPMVFYGKKWLLGQLWREIAGSPLPGFVKRRKRQ